MILYLGNCSGAIFFFVSAAVYLYFVERNITVHEDEGTAHVCLELQEAFAPTQDEIWVTFTTQNSSAIGIANVVNVMFHSTSGTV